MKKNLNKILYLLVSGIFFGFFGLLKFIKYGASNCDNPGKLCDCFCCSAFGLRGYEACGNYGFFVGTSIGIIVGYILYLLSKNILKSKKYAKNRKVKS